jgi:hypothetical protein
MSDETNASDGDSTRADATLKLGKKLFDLVRPEAVALGGALLDRGVRAVMDGDIKVRVGAGPAPGTRRKSKATAKPKDASEDAPEVEEAVIIEAEFTVADGPGPDDASVESDVAASTINIDPAPKKKPASKKSRVPHTDGPILGASKMRYRCLHCNGTWSEVYVVEKCPRCAKPDWMDGAPEEL